MVGRREVGRWRGAMIVVVGALLLLLLRGKTPVAGSCSTVESSSCLWAAAAAAAVSTGDHRHWVWRRQHDVEDTLDHATRLQAQPVVAVALGVQPAQTRHEHAEVLNRFGSREVRRSLHAAL